MERTAKTIEVTQHGRPHIDEALEEIASRLEDEFCESPRAVLAEIKIEKAWTRSTDYCAHYTYVFHCDGYPRNPIETISEG